jgi:hypothetical protein
MACANVLLLVVYNVLVFRTCIPFLQNKIFGTSTYQVLVLIDTVRLGCPMKDWRFRNSDSPGNYIV